MGEFEMKLDILNPLKRRSAANARWPGRHRTSGPKWRLAIPAIAILAAACVVARGDNTPIAPPPTSSTRALAPELPPVLTPASFIVKLAGGLSADEQQAVLARDGGNETSSVAALPLHTIETSSDTLDLTIFRYQSDPQVASV